MLALGQALDVEMQSADMRYRKPRQDAFKGVHGWEEKTGYRVLSCGCVSVCKAYPPLLRASQPVGARSDCGGRELVRAVALGDVNMAMLSWHRS